MDVQVKRIVEITEVNNTDPILDKLIENGISSDTIH